MKILLVFLFLASFNLNAQEVWNRLYTASHIGLAAAAGADLYSSQRSIGVVGVREANPLFRRSDGGYNPYTAIPAKVGYHAGYYFLHRNEVKKNPRLKKMYTVINLTLVGFLSYVSINNVRNVNYAKRNYNGF